MKNFFSVLKEETLMDELYESGPWVPENTKYLESQLSDRLSHEVLDLYEWIQPTEFEKHIRLLVIKRFITVIENFFKGSVVIPQGSSSTDTYLPISDIDLIVLNAPINLDIIEVLRILSKLFLKAKMISNFKVIDHANVPIVKLTERPFGFNIDICVSNINGALNIPRIRKVLTIHPNFKVILMFFKLFIYLNSIDDPAKGGFGSNQIINFVLFGFQSRPDLADHIGLMILYLLDIFANKINFFLVGISTVNGGRLFSKLKTDAISAGCPQAFVCEDPQFRSNFFGVRTAQSLILRQICKTALYAMSKSDFKRVSPLTSFLPDFNELLTRRSEFDRFGQLFTRSLYEFSRTTDEIPTYIPRGKHQIPPFMQREKESGIYDPKKSNDMKFKKKQKNEMKKHQMLMNKIQILRAQEEKNIKVKKKQQKKANRGPTPPRYRR